MNLSHKVYDRATKSMVTVSRGTCGASLKAFPTDAEFDEILFCQRCGARMRIARTEDGAATAYILPKSIRVETEDQPVRVIGKSKPSKIIKMESSEFEQLILASA